MFDIKDKVVLITGGASGIGLACAEEMLRNGCRGIAIVDINNQKGILEKNNLCKQYGEGKVIFVTANVVVKTELEEAFKKTVGAYKQLDVVFNNAGLVQEIDYETCLDVNIKGMVHCLKLAMDEYLPKYKSDHEAIIINTASLTGLKPFTGVEIYTVTKHATVALTKSFGVEFHYKRTGVRVIAICPNVTQTDMLTQFRLQMCYEELQSAFDKVTSSENTQTPEQVAKVCAKLIQDAENGSVWYIGLGKEAKVSFPDILEDLNVTF